MRASEQHPDRNRKRVAIVDDDDLFRESLGLNLEDEGFDVVDFCNGQRALEHFLTGGDVDAVLLDWRMPVMDGLTFLHRLRKADVPVPVLFLTQFDDDAFQETALRWGAVDFIDKSRSLSIILKRLRLVTDGLKLTSAGPHGNGRSVRRGKLELRLDARKALWDGRAVDLSVTEFQIIHLIVTQVDNDVSYDQIYDEIAGDSSSEPQKQNECRVNVRSHIKRIRQKFREVDDDFAGIENYAGFGYRWVDED